MNLKSILSRFINLINIPKHLKKIYLKLKIKHHQEDEKNSFFAKVTNVLNTLILILFIGGIIYLNYFYQDRYLLIISLLLILFILYMIRRKRADETLVEGDEVSQLVLKDPDNKNIQQWNITGEVSLIFGKEDVDIDLSNAVYSSLISRQHAVMNNTGDNWYFEDIGSQNGSGLKKRNGNTKFKVQRGKPYQINVGDVIYIANTKILIK